MGKHKESAFVYAISPITNATLLGRKSMKSAKAGKWGFFGGKVKKDEHPRAAAKREFLEETGIIPTNIGPQITIKLNKRTIHVFPFVGLSEDGPKIRLSDEHSAFEWQNENSKIGEINLTRTAKIIMASIEQIMVQFEGQQIDPTQTIEVAVTITG